MLIHVNFIHLLIAINRVLVKQFFGNSKGVFMIFVDHDFVFQFMSFHGLHACSCRHAVAEFKTNLFVV